MVVGNNGILSRAVNAKTQSIIADEKGLTEIAYSSAVTDSYFSTEDYKKVTREMLQNELDSIKGSGKTVVSGNSDNEEIFEVLFVDTNNKYTVNNGVVAYASTETSSNDNSDIEYAVTTNPSSWSTTVSFPVPADSFTLEQKREISAYLFDFNNYNEMKAAFSQMSEGEFTWDDYISDAGMNEEQALDLLIDIGKNCMNCKNTEKLKSLGVKVTSIQTPYNTTLYASNLGSTAYCSFNQNGKYTFKITDESGTSTKTIDINNIRKSSENSNHKVKINSADGILYSTDQTNWSSLSDDLIIDCQDKIFFKFEADSTIQSGGTNACGLHYVEKNNEFYKYFNDEHPEEWASLRASYYINGILFENEPDFASAFLGMTRLNLTHRQYLLYAGMKRTEIFDQISLIMTPDVIDFCNKSIELYGNDARNQVGFCKTSGNNQEYPQALKSAYPKFSIGNDNVITWSGEKYNNGVESPIYTLNVDHDMELFMFREEWD